MSKKSAHIALRIEQFRGKELPAHYLGYFDCFNRQLFYEAHDILEDMWLPDRRGQDGDFYKGLIQLAGAFVHVQKNRPRPAQALLRLARANLQKYPMVHHALNLGDVLVLIERWHAHLEGRSSTDGMFVTVKPPCLKLAGSRSAYEEYGVTPLEVDEAGEKALAEIKREKVAGKLKAWKP